MDSRKVTLHPSEPRPLHHHALATYPQQVLAVGVAQRTLATFLSRARTSDEVKVPGRSGR